MRAPEPGGRARARVAGAKLDGKPCARAALSRRSEAALALPRVGRPGRDVGVATSACGRAAVSALGTALEPGPLGPGSVGKVTEIQKK